MAGQQAAGPQGGRQGRPGPEVLGHGGVATGAVAVAVRPAGPAVVVVGPSVVGGDWGAGDAAWSPPRARSAPGPPPDGPPAIVATDNTVCGGEPACDTAITASTMATLVTATNSARGVNRRIQRRCTDLTSHRLPTGGAGAHTRPDPSR